MLEEITGNLSDLTVTLESSSQPLSRSRQLWFNRAYPFSLKCVENSFTFSISPPFTHTLKSSFTKVLLSLYENWGSLGSPESARLLRSWRLDSWAACSFPVFVAAPSLELYSSGPAVVNSSLDQLGVRVLIISGMCKCTFQGIFPETDRLALDNSTFLTLSGLGISF